MVKQGHKEVQQTDDALKRSQKIVEDTIQVSIGFWTGDCEMLRCQQQQRLQQAKGCTPSHTIPRSAWPQQNICDLGGDRDRGDAGRADEADGGRAEQPR